MHTLEQAYWNGVKRAQSEIQSLDTEEYDSRKRKKRIKLMTALLALTGAAGVGYGAYATRSAWIPKLRALGLRVKTKNNVQVGDVVTPSDIKAQAEAMSRRYPRELRPAAQKQLEDIIRYPHAYIPATGTVKSSPSVIEQIMNGNAPPTLEQLTAELSKNIEPSKSVARNPTLGEMLTPSFVYDILGSNTPPENVLPGVDVSQYLPEINREQPRVLKALTNVFNQAHDISTTAADKVRGAATGVFGSISRK